MSFFQKIDSKIPLKKQSQKCDPVLFGNPEDADVYILTSEYNKGFIRYYNQVLYKVLDPETKVCVLYTYRIIPEGNDDKNIGDFVRAYTIELEKYIRPWSKVICTGRAIYSITQETELTVEAFYAYRYVQSYFFAPQIKSWIFPVDDPFKFISLGSRKFLDTFSFHFFRHQVEQISTLDLCPVRIPELKVEIIKDPNEFLKQYIGKEMKVAWDLETDGLLYYKCRVICLTLSFDGKTGYYLPWEKIDPAVLTDFFEGKYQIGANLKFDVKFLMLNGVENVHVDFDTMAAGHVLNEMRSNSLGSHGWIYTYYGGHEVPLLKYRKANKTITNYGQIPQVVLSDYAAKDAIITYKVYEQELKLLEEDREKRKGQPNLYDYFFNEMMPNINMYTKIEMNGVYMDIERLDRFYAQLYQKRKELEEIIFSDVGERFNLSSTQELAKVIRDVLHWPDLGEKSKAGDFLTGSDALDEWEKRGYTLATTLKQWKEISTFIKTFTGTPENPESGWRQFVDSEGFLHPTYRVMMAESGRQKCNCFWGKEKLLTNQGYIAFEDLGFKEGYLPYEGNLKVIDDEGKEREISHSYKGVSSELYEFVLEDGSCLRVTPEHMCIVQRAGEEVTCFAYEVQSNDLFIQII